MHDIITMLLGALNRMDFPQLAHAVAALLALFYGRRFEPWLRLALWASLAALLTGLGAAGFYWGRPGLPTLLTAFADPYLFRPVPGLIELTTPDHVIQLFLGAVFSAATGLTALHAFLADRAAARAARAAGSGAAAPAPAAPGLAWLPPIALYEGETMALPPLARRAVIGGAGARAALAQASRRLRERGPRKLLSEMIVRRA